MKFVAGIGIIVVLAGALYISMDKFRAGVDPEETVAIGIEPVNGTVTAHLAVTDLMVKHDPPKLQEGGGVDWYGWLNAHFELRDASGTVMSWQRLGQSRLVSGFEGGISDQFLEYTLQPGATYTLTYTRVAEIGLRFRGPVTMPTGTSPDSLRVALKIVQEK